MEKSNIRLGFIILLISALLSGLLIMFVGAGVELRRVESV
jgi:hypothetical protein